MYHKEDLSIFAIHGRFKVAPAHPSENHSCIVRERRFKFWQGIKKLKRKEDGIEGGWEKLGAQKGKWEKERKRSECGQKTLCPLAVHPAISSL